MLLQTTFVCMRLCIALTHSLTIFKLRSSTYLVAELVVGACDAGPIADEHSGRLRTLETGASFAHDPAVPSGSIRFHPIRSDSIRSGFGWVQHCEFIW